MPVLKLKRSEVEIVLFYEKGELIYHLSNNIIGEILDRIVQLNKYRIDPYKLKILKEINESSKEV